MPSSVQCGRSRLHSQGVWLVLVLEILCFVSGGGVGGAGGLALRTFCSQSTGCIEYWDVDSSAGGGQHARSGGDSPRVQRLRGGEMQRGGWGRGGGGRGGGGWGGGGGRGGGEKRYKHHALYTIPLAPDPDEKPLNASEVRTKAAEAIRDGAINEALKLSMQAEILEPDHPNLPLATAVLLQEIGNYTEAEAKLRALLAVTPMHAPALCALATIVYKENHNLNESQRLLYRALAASPDDGGVHACMGDFVRETDGPLSEYKTCYSRALKLAPNHTSALVGMGMCLWKEGGFEQSEAMFRRALEQEPAMPVALTKYAELLMEMRRFEEAEKLYDKAMYAQVNHVPTLLSYGRFLYEIRKDFAKADTHLNIALELRPTDTSVLMQGARYKQHVSEDLEGAELLLSAVTTLEPSNFANWANFGMLLWNGMQNYSAAAGMFKEAIERASPEIERAPILTTYAEMIETAPTELLLEAGGWDTLGAGGCTGGSGPELAESLHREAVRCDPQSVRCLYNFGVFQSEQADARRRLPEALQTVEAALALEPSHLDALVLKSKILQKQKDGGGAEQALRMALMEQDAADEQRADLIAEYVSLLSTYPGKERYEDAAELLLRAEALAPGHPLLDKERRYLDAVSEGTLEQVRKKRDEVEHVRNRFKARFVIAAALSGGRYISRQAMEQVEEGAMANTLLLEAVRALMGFPQSAKLADQVVAVADLIGELVREGLLSTAQCAYALAHAVRTLAPNPPPRSDGVILDAQGHVVPAKATPTKGPRNQKSAPPPPAQPAVRLVGVVRNGTRGGNRGARSAKEVARVLLEMPKFTMPAPPAKNASKDAFAPFWVDLPPTLDSEPLKALNASLLSPSLRRVALFTGLLYARDATRIAPIAQALASLHALGTPQHEAFSELVLVAITSAAWWRGEGEEGGGTFEGPSWTPVPCLKAEDLPPDWPMPPGITKGPDDLEMPPGYTDPLVDWGGPLARSCARLCWLAHTILRGAWEIYECE